MLYAYVQNYNNVESKHCHFLPTGIKFT